ncbi:MAG: hypothetical protein IJ793_00070 [Opitutales bacterium]|nr:hypothetical protein [Opitutales bacterium]
MQETHIHLQHLVLKNFTLLPNARDFKQPQQGVVEKYLCLKIDFMVGGFERFARERYLIRLSATQYQLKALLRIRLRTKNAPVYCRRAYRANNDVTYAWRK